MKRALLLLIMLFFIAPATEAQRRDSKRISKFHMDRSTEPIMFIENNVLFSVLPDGSFKFKRVTNKSENGYRKHVWHKRSLKVKRDRYGRIVRVGKVPIFYKRGKIDRIGSVDFKYRRGQLKKVGDLYIVYRRNGQLLYLGVVKKYHPYFAYKSKRFS